MEMEMNVEMGIEDGSFDPLCAICDDGGCLIRCAGRCMRSFHANEYPDRNVSRCETLGLTRAEVEAMGIYICRNCEYNQHQCFVCGELGSSDILNGADVYQCASATCRHFYHPRCAATLLFPNNVADAFNFQQRIERGDPFSCPVHKCVVCDGHENMEVNDLQFAMCRRCPTMYHRRCLPREIIFDDGRERPGARAWNGFLQNKRIMIYCLEHEIDEELGTPIRNHIIFPGVNPGMPV